MDDVNGRLPGGQGFRPDMVKTILPAAGQHQLVHDVRNFLTELPGGLNLNLATLYQV